MVQKVLIVNPDLTLVDFDALAAMPALLPAELGPNGALAVEGPFNGGAGGNPMNVNVQYMPLDISILGTITTADITAPPHNTPTTGSFVQIAIPSGCASVGLQLGGTWTGGGQIEFEGSVNGTTFLPVSASNGYASVNATAANGIFILPGAGYQLIRVRASVWGTGTVTAWFQASIGTTASVLTGPIPAGTNMIGYVGSASQAIALHSTATRTTSGTDAAVLLLGGYKRYIILMNLTATTGVVGDTMDVYVDVSSDGVTWINAVHFTQVTGISAARKEIAVLDPSAPGAVVIDVTSEAAAGVVRPALFGAQMRTRRVVVDAGAHGQSFTFSVTALAQ